MPLNFIRKQRRCGCDCRDKDLYEVDPNIFNPLMRLDTPCENGDKMPCLYIARFPCDVNYLGEQITNTRMPFRHMCEFPAQLHQYVSLLGYQSGTPINNFVIYERDAEYPYACTWAQRYTTKSQTGLPFLQEDWWNRAEGAIKWTLDPMTIVGTLRHELGISYSLYGTLAWDCYGPNTLKLDAPLRGSTDWLREIPGLPQFVCITPGITTEVYRPDCCSNCWQCELPAINYTIDKSDNLARIPEQRLDFIPNENEAPWIPEMTGACRYQADIITYVVGYADPVRRELSEVWAGRPTRDTVSLDIASPMNEGQPSQATITIRYYKTDVGDVFGSAGSYNRIASRYHCTRFTCDGPNTFQRVTNDPDLPQTLTLTSHNCFASETNDSGPCPGVSDAGLSVYNGYNKWTDHEPGARTDYTNENTRYVCTDPWCECMPGYITIKCLDMDDQRQGWQPGVLLPVSPGFCTGGLEGRNFPAGPSRSLCATFYDTIATEHEICVVIYCDGDSSTATLASWQTEWYCDGDYAGQGGIGNIQSCPFRAEYRAPPLPCFELNDCTGCAAFNIISNLCLPPELPCCDPPEDSITVSVGASDGSCYPGPGSFTLPLVPVPGSPYRWAGDDDTSTSWTLTCAGGIYTIRSPENNITGLVNSSYTCEPFQVNFVEDSGDCIGQVITVTA